jgi:DNA modification methylase
MIATGDSLDLIRAYDGPLDLVVTDPPYAWSGTADEHALTATVALVLNEAARRLSEGAWMLMFSAASWRSTSYMVESIRGVLRPVRVGHWLKPTARTKTKTPGWAWASVHVVACCKGTGRGVPHASPDYIIEPPFIRGRRAQLPAAVADWAVAPYAVPGGVFLDPFAGSGALVEAATRAGMQAIGYDRAGVA